MPLKGLHSPFRGLVCLFVCLSVLTLSAWTQCVRNGAVLLTATENQKFEGSSPSDINFPMSDPGRLTSRQTDRQSGRQALIGST